jgi:hypothetical protein
VSIDDNAFSTPDDPQQETLSEAFADYLGLVDETIRTQVTDDYIRARIRRALDRGASGAHWPNGVRETGGRRALLDELQALIHSPQPGPVVLAGPGGMGKTTMAGAVAEHARALGDQVWWISAADPVTMSESLRAATEQLGVAHDIEVIARGGVDAADRFWRLLDNASSRWLLVFDEADDPRVLAAGDSPAGIRDLTGWVRSSARGLALVTSRETDPEIWEAAQLRRLGELREADATRMLLELAPSAGDADQARELARRLDWHPLSLRLAGSYLRTRAAQGDTFAAYERALSEEADRYARGRHTAAPAQTLTARTLKLSLDGLARHGMPQTRRVLELASCYASTMIPATLLNADSVTDVLATLDDSSPAGRGDADAALRMLKDTGIFELTEDGIALHTAITEAGRASLDGPDGSSARIRHAAIELLAASAAKLPFDQPTAWPQYMLFGSHLLGLLETTADQVDRDHLGQLMETVARTANAFNHSRAGRAGSVLCERALAHVARLGNEHRAVLRVRHQMAWPIADRGDLDDAEALYRDVFQIRLRVFGPQDKDLLDSRHELAWIAACKQDWVMAEKGYRETLDDSIRILDQEDPRISLTRHELAWVIANQDQNRLGEAREIFRKVLTDRRRILGAEHPRTLTTLHELTWIAARQGKWVQAEADYRKLLDLRLRILTEDHPETLVTRHELAWVAARRGRIPEAESGYSDVLEHRRRTLGEDHPQTLATQEALEELRRGRIIDASHLA